MATVRLPGLIDAHVHLREPGYTHKEDFYTGTAAALAGGVTAVLDMPNTSPPTDTPERFADKAALAAAKAVCDVGLFVGATTDQLDAYLPIAHRACGLKIYVSETFGSLRIEDLGLLHRFFRSWAERVAGGKWQGEGGRWQVESGRRRSEPAEELQVAGDESSPPSPQSPVPNPRSPIAVHAEELMLPVCLNLSHLYDVPLHIVHVTRRSEIELIRRAKERGYPVTCEVTPHHLFLSSNDLSRLGTRGDMRPRLASPDDVAALWENLSVVDIFATDHAPHTLAEKTQPTPPPGVPGVETLLPLLLTAVHDGRLTLDDILLRCVENPRRIYRLPEQPATFVDVDVDAGYLLTDASQHSKAGWTPFAGKSVFGQVEQVILRGQVVYDGERVLVEPGSGQVFFQSV